MELVVSGWGRDHGEKVIAKRDLTEARSSAFGGYLRPEVYLTTTEGREMTPIGVRAVEHGNVELRFYAKIVLNGEYLVRQTMSRKEVVSLFLSLYDDCTLNELLGLIDEIKNVTRSRKLPPVMLKRIDDVGLSDQAVAWFSKNMIWRVGDLVQRTETELRRLAGYQDEYLYEILNRLIPLGLRLGMDVSNMPVTPAVPEVLLKKIDELELSIRSANCLKNDNIIYIGQLVQKREADLLRTPNFGRKSVYEIRDVLAEMNLHLGMEVPGWKQIEQGLALGG